MQTKGQPGLTGYLNISENFPGANNGEETIVHHGFHVAW
jgi:hypothetical protein